MMIDMSNSTSNQRRTQYTHQVVSQPVIKRGCDEDGPYEYQTGEFRYYVESVSADGRIYATDSMTEQQANEFVSTLAADADIANDLRFGFVRIIYGSDSWGAEQEWELSLLD